MCLKFMWVYVPKNNNVSLCKGPSSDMLVVADFMSVVSVVVSTSYLSTKVSQLSWIFDDK